MTAARETEWARRTRREAGRATYIAANGNVCQICGATPKTRGLHEDHDHDTGAHRGWLCWKCNDALPKWVTVEWMLKAYLYLGGETTLIVGGKGPARIEVGP
jgi:hypothetical protein